MTPAADRRIFQRPDRLFCRVNNFQMFDFSLAAFASDYPRQRADGSLINISHPESGRIRFVPRSYGADNRHPGFLCRVNPFVVSLISSDFIFRRTPPVTQVNRKVSSFAHQVNGFIYGQQPGSSSRLHCAGRQKKRASDFSEALVCGKQDLKSSESVHTIPFRSGLSNLDSNIKPVCPFHTLPTDPVLSLFFSGWGIGWAITPKR